MKKKLGIVLLCLCCCVITSAQVYARAGGGSSGGSSGSPFDLILFLGIGYLFVNQKRYSSRMHAKIVAISIKKEMKKQGALNYWENSKMKKHVKEAYFNIQECWKREDELYAKEYLSKALLEEFHTKLSWIKIRKEEVVQKNVTLLYASPVAFKMADCAHLEYIWYYIEGSMVGYYINSETSTVVRGNKRNEKFIEYWQFVYENGTWVLNRIKQQEEVEMQDLWKSE